MMLDLRTFGESLIFALSLLAHGNAAVQSTMLWIIVGVTTSS